MQAAAKFLKDVSYEEFRFGRFVAWFPEDDLPARARKLPFQFFESDPEKKRLIPEDRTPSKPPKVHTWVTCNTGQLLPELERRMARVNRRVSKY